MCSLSDLIALLSALVKILLLYCMTCRMEWLATAVRVLPVGQENSVRPTSMTVLVSSVNMEECARYKYCGVGEEILIKILLTQTCFLCQDQVNGFMCLCAEGYFGDNCETEHDECSSSPCINGVCHVSHCLLFYAKTKSLLCTCAQDLVAGYRCSCTHGWTGTNCDQDINECNHNPSPCVHGSCMVKLYH